MIDTANPFLRRLQNPDTIDVNIAANVDAIGMLDSAMAIGKQFASGIPQVRHSVVAAQFIGIDHAARSDVFLDHSSQSEVLLDVKG